MGKFSYTFQDYEAAHDKLTFLESAIASFRLCDEYNEAVEAREYFKQKNRAILENVKKLYNMTGTAVTDFTATNVQLCSNFFHRLVVQRCTYLLGNGVSFAGDKGKDSETTKERVGQDFDRFIFSMGKNALVDGVSFGLWNRDHGHVFPLTEFMPLYDEYDGTLKAGARFWSLDWDRKPVTVVLYEEDGYTTYRTRDGRLGLDLEEYEPKRGYIQIVQHSEADGDTVVGEQNYSVLPIVPMWGNSMKCSALNGIRNLIDAYDLINSGIANDLNDCAQVYWLLGNASGMSNDELIKFRDQLKFMHIGVVDMDNSSVTPYTQDVPVQSRQACLADLRSQIYEAFGGLDVHVIAAGATNDHIDAAYQVVDEEADDFEYQVADFVKQILKLMDITDTPEFKRNKISNVKEQVEIVMMEAQYIDPETLLKKLPNIYPEEVQTILDRRDAAAASMMMGQGDMNA